MSLCIPTFQLTHDSSFPVEWNCLLGFSLFFYFFFFCFYFIVQPFDVYSSSFHLLNRTRTDFFLNIYVCCPIRTYDIKLCCIPCINNEKCFFLCPIPKCEVFFFGMKWFLWQFYVILFLVNELQKKKGFN